VASLLAFNVGIEIGQIGVLAVMLPVLALVRRHVLTGRVGMIILSALTAHIAWHWMTDRWDALSKVGWPQPSLSGFVTLALWTAGILLAAGGVMAIAHRLRLATGPALASPQRGAAD
jgi:TRAP-type C4-dicarboxylate transport system permease small subunit